MARHPACRYCGNNPIPHFVNWYFESINILFTPIRQWLLGSFLARVIRAVSRRLNVSGLAVRFFHMAGIISFQTDRQKCTIRRAGVLWEEAEKRGLVMSELLLFGKPFDTYVVWLPKFSIFNFQFSNPFVFSGLPRPETSSPKRVDIMDDKAVLKKRLKEAGLPVPEGGSVVTFRGAKKIFQRVRKPVIVKPRAGSRGRHSTTFIYTKEDLRQAFLVAKQLCFWVMVEEHIQGPVYRATVIDGKLCGVLRGDSPQVTGDGAHTIAELVAVKNNLPHPGVKDIILDDKAEIFLLRQKYSFTTVLENGKTVSLTEKIGVGYGGSSSEDLDICHPDKKELFLQAASVVGDPLVGFDFIIEDITKSWREQHCGFIEANSLPFINLHHDPLLGTPQNAAAGVWDMMQVG